jgi:hypothetical protein
LHSREKEPQPREKIVPRQSRNAVPPLCSPHYIHTTDIYDPKTGQFSPGPPLAKYRFNPIALLLSTGRVVVAGGAERVTDGAFARSVEVLDLATFAFTEGPGTLSSRDYRQGVVIGPNLVLLTGNLPVEILEVP